MKERPPVWRVADNILNNQSQTATRGGPPAWGLCEVLVTPGSKSVQSYDTFTDKALDLD